MVVVVVTFVHDTNFQTNHQTIVVLLSSVFKAEVK
jgi:hypothetical protein